jgi:RNA 2',3'-cyclic 3'-phosphodiesterase
LRENFAVRVFYALWPGPDTRVRIADTAGVLSLGNAARLVPAENYHLTLAFVGEVSPARLAVLQQIGRNLRMAGCTIRFDAYEYWPESQAVVALASEAPAELTELSRQLHNFDGTHRFDRLHRPLRPHVTLARKVAQAPVLQAMSSFDWSARSFSLVCSDTSGAHSVYTVVDTWPLLYELPIA